MKHLITEEGAGRRIDSYISELLEDKTRSAIQKLIDDGNVTVNQTEINKNYRLKMGDEIDIVIPAPKMLDVVPQDLPIEIVYEDDDIIIVNKQKGMVVHPAPGNPDNTLVNALLYHCGERLSGINGVIRPGIVHRIDKDTSGLLIIAKNDAVHYKLADMIKEHNFLREYEAVVYGTLKETEGVVEAPIGRDPKNRQRMAVVLKGGKPAKTYYKVITQYDGFAHVRLRLETGRTHQIRVHMSHVGHAVAGDAVYGPKKCITALRGQCLHAGKIGFVHPVSNQYIEFSSPLPQYFEQFLKSLRQL